MKLLMPNTSAGMVIGKAGASIKEIREYSGCQIQVRAILEHFTYVSVVPLSI